MDEDRKREYALARARFKELFCGHCKNVGVLRIRIDDTTGTLCLCNCEQGSKQPWALPSIDTLKDPKTACLKWEDFHPGVHAKHLSKEGIAQFIPERVAWWRSKIEIAENYWMSLKEQGETSGVSIRVQDEQVQSQTD